MKLRHVALALAAAHHVGAGHPLVGIEDLPRESVARPSAHDPPHGLTRAEWDHIRGAIRRSEYHVRRVPGPRAAFHAVNRGQAYGTDFGRDGIEILPTAHSASWRLRLSVVGYGEPGHVRPVPPADPDARKERVEYDRDVLTEWYVNRPGGLEQGFELRAPAVKRGGPVVVDLSVDGDLTARDGPGNTASFIDESGETVIRYAGLKAWDASGRALMSRLEASGRKMRLLVHAQSARFPVTVDPVFLHEAEVFGHPDPIAHADAECGNSVSVSGDTAVIGCPLDDASASIAAGSAYVFVRSGTVWTEQQRIVAPDGTADDHFGWSVSLSGDTAVVGAPNDANDTGAAYVFVRSGSSWTAQQKLVAPDGGPNEGFGQTVSVDGDTVVVGTPFQTFQSGAAYVFVRTGATWILEQKLVASDPGASDQFGFAVSLSADIAVIGAHQDSTPGGVSAGSAYVFLRAGASWVQQQKLEAADGAAGDAFGRSVAVGADTAVVGAPFDDNLGGVNAGSAYVFARSGTIWSLQQKLMASDGALSAHLGASVSLWGDTAVVGASESDAAGVTDAGAAYVFLRSGTLWTQEQKLVAPDGATGDRLGHSVSISGDTVVAGARLDNVLGSLDAGSAEVFLRSGTSWSEQQRLTGSLSGAAFEQFGASVSASGDTAVIGAPRDATAGGMDAGSAYVFVRSGGVWTEQQKLVASDGHAGAFFGDSVSIQGDTVVVGARLAQAPGGSAGAAYVFARTGTVWAEQQKLMASDGLSGDFFGGSVSISGDTVVVGADRDENGGGFEAGAAYVFVRTGSVWAEQQKLVASDGADYDNFGFSVALDGDRAVVGAPQDDDAGLSAGSSYVFERAGTIWTQQAKLLALDAAAADFFGYSAALSGSTVLVGAYADDNVGGQNAGAAYVFVAAGTGWGQQQKLLAPDGAEGDEFGRAVSIAGDVAAVGASFDDSLAPNAGSAYVFARSGTTWSQQQKLVAPDGAAGDLFGEAVFLSGDTVVVGALSDDTATDGPDAGSAHVFRQQPAADIGVTKTDGQSTAVPGLPLTYTITVANAGPDAVMGASVVDVVPSALGAPTWTCVASPGSSCTPGGAGNIFDTIDLLVGGTATYTLTASVHPAATGTLTNTAGAAPPAGVLDPNIANNEASDSDDLTPQADLTIDKSASVEPVPPGGALTYAVSIVNAGPSNATSVTMVDSLPAGVTFVSSSPGSPTCTVFASTVTCTLGTLAPAANSLVTINVTVNAATGVLVNTANVSSGEGDPDPANNSASVTTTIRGAKGELGHGSVAMHDLAAQPGPMADLDVFLLSQRPYSSYEVLVDATSGDIGIGAGPIVQRIGPDGTTVLQDSSPIGAGPSRSLRWRNTTAGQMDDQTVRIRSAGCTTDCGADDVYRIRTYETTYSVPRFNNVGSQLTVLVLHNPTTYPISGDIYFWEAGATLVATEPFVLAGKQTLVLNTTSVAGGVAGTITVAHDGRYGDLAGKTVALEPATGLSFDTALEPRP